MKIELINGRSVNGQHYEGVVDFDDATATMLLRLGVATVYVEPAAVEDEKPLTPAQKKALAKAEAEAKSKAEAEAAAAAQAEVEAQAPKDNTTDDPLAAAIADAETKKGE